MRVQRPFECILPLSTSRIDRDLHDQILHSRWNQCRFNEAQNYR